MCPYQQECCRNCQKNRENHPSADVFFGRVLIAILALILLLGACGIIPMS